MEDLLKEDVAVLAMGLYLSMSKTDMRGYWHRIFRDDMRAIGGSDGSDGQGSPDEGTGRSE